MKVNGITPKNKVKENKNFQMVMYMKDNGKMINLMVKVYMNITMEINTKEVSIMVKRMVKEYV